MIYNTGGMNKKRILIFCLLLAAAGGFLVYYSNKVIADAGSGRLFNDVSIIPYNKTGLLPGTSKLLKNGHINPYYLYRIDAAVKLLAAGKIKYVIISGDNGRLEYNEPALMRADLIGAGVDSSVIFADYAGFRTFDSVIRLKEVFGQDSVTIISQQFHNEWAIYIAERENIDAIAFNAKDVSIAMGRRTQLREKLARVKVLMDFWMGKSQNSLEKKSISRVSNCLASYSKKSPRQ